MRQFKDDPSDSDSDSCLLHDIHSISQACFPSSPSVDDVNDVNDNDDDDDDDYKLLRTIQFKFGDDVINTDSPLSSLIDNDNDSDNDFETLLSIQSRFSDHNTPSPEFVVDDDDDDDDDFEILVSIQHKFADHNAPSHDAKDHVSATSISLWQSIKNNRSCQKFLREKLLHLDTVIQNNNALRKRVKTLRDYQIHCNREVAHTLSRKYCPYARLFSTHTISKNASAMSYGPLDNAQVLSSRAAFSRFPVTFRRKKWSNLETSLLRKGLVQQCQEMLFQRMADDANGSVGVDEVVSKVAGHVISPETIQDFCVSGKVNWERLALVSVPGRSGAECEARWFNFENRLINKTMWAAQEEKKLLGIILGRKGKQVPRLHDWTGIATQLGTNRTPYQCLVHFQRSLNPNILKTVWTEVEDAQLRSAVVELGVNDWQAVASRLERRNGIQCSDRWRKYLDPVKTRVGRWVDDEDKRLNIAVKFLGKRWVRVAQFVPGRTDVQCRDRWENVFDPGLRSGEWSKKEDLLLKAAVAKYGSSSWSKVALRVGARTDNQCWRRWKMLFPCLAVKARAARIVQKIALPSNFVGREWERPSLEAKDFSLSLTNHTTEELPASKRGRSLKRRRSTRNCGSKQTSCGESKNDAPKSKKRSSKRTELDEGTDMQSCKNKESGKTTERDLYECHNYWTRSRRCRDIMVKADNG